MTLPAPSLARPDAGAVVVPEPIAVTPPETAPEGMVWVPGGTLLDGRR